MLHTFDENIPSKYRGVTFHETEERCNIWRESTCCFKSDIRNLRNFDQSTHSEVSKIFTLMGSFWAKHIFFELKKYSGVIFHQTEEGYKIWRGIDLSFQNWHKEFDKFWPEHSKVSKIFILMGSFWAKYILFELKKYRGVIFHDIEEWCKIWRKTDLLLRKWHEEFGKFSPEHSKVSKLELWGDSFVQTRKCMSLKFTVELCLDNEEWYKNWRGTDLSFQNWHEELHKFWPKQSKV